MSLNDQIFGKMQEFMGEATGIELPPKVFTEAGGEFVRLDLDEKLLICRFPVLERYLNPLRHVQGGAIALLLDNTLGPLSYMVAPPSTTTQMHINYIRPITAEQSHVEIEAQVIEQTRRFLFMQARAISPEGKPQVMCDATAMVL